MIRVVTNTHYFPRTLIDFRFMFMLNILVDLIKSGRNIDIIYAKTCATTNISTMVGYHVVLATLLFKRVFRSKFSNIG